MPTLFYSGLPRCPMPIKADQCQLKFCLWSQCRSITPLVWCIDSFTNVLLMPWFGIDRHWQELIDIERHFRSMPWFWLALIGIGHWSRESLSIVRAIPLEILREEVKWKILSNPAHIILGGTPSPIHIFIFDFHFAHLCRIWNGIVLSVYGSLFRIVL